MTRLPENNRAYLLLEVLLSLAILSFCLLSVIRALDISADAAVASDDYSTAMSLAKNRMEDVASMEYLPIGETEGRFEGDYELFWWKMEISQTSNDNLVRVVLVIFWQRGSGTESMAVQTIMPKNNLTKRD